jgi:hypothetical protein
VGEKNKMGKMGKIDMCVLEELREVSREEKSIR